MSESKPPKIDLTGYRYAPALPAIEIVSYALISPIIRLRTKENRKLILSLTDLTALVGVDLENEENAKAVQTHQNRMRTYFVFNAFISTILYLTIGILALAFIIFTIIFMSRGGSVQYITGKYTTWISTAVFFLIFITAFRLALRVTNTVIDRYFADTLAYLACLNLLIHLAKENALMFT